MTKPGVLHRQLLDVLKLDEDKAEALVTVWASSAKGIVEQLRQKSVFPSQLEDFGWALNIETASYLCNKQKELKAVLQFGLKSNLKEINSKENLIVEFNHGELYEFYKQLETIQTQLDSLC
uniref:COMM domain-containing protein n=1 Tax=Timema poppense TaxID=170557 RepID=A0A7R9DSS9_TIMPO|nr:unnamed protein product [Timema poppensis]